MTIGQLARRVGIRPSAIRYYEAQGILMPPMRSASEYRLYGSETVSMIRFVQRARELGFSLEQIRQIVDASRDDLPCTACRKLINQRLAKWKRNCVSCALCAIALNGSRVHRRPKSPMQSALSSKESNSQLTGRGIFHWRPA